uniref:Uncharacterized protein n=1 Tax=Utricularia reniformis TaxID=192314 RepID=A0A1Y0B2G4_9LAMI|nr:hypothetical protein AEK19_MT1388 [Utricularia reniformis]ART31584.1 hypothetical protein AEK19_MT1388 [Utricularia reniformis]
MSWQQPSLLNQKNDQSRLTRMSEPSSFLYIIRRWKDGIRLGYPDLVRETETGIVRLVSNTRTICLQRTSRSMKHARFASRKMPKLMEVNKEKTGCSALTPSKRKEERDMVSPP